MNTIVGMRIPDSALARDARDHARALSPDFLLAPVEGTYVFGAIATAGADSSPAAYAPSWLAETAHRCGGGSLPAFDSFLRRDPFATEAP